MLATRSMIRHEDRIDQLVALIATGRVEHRETTDRLVALVEHTQEAASLPHPDLAELVALVDRLCQRLQAPEQAVMEHAMAQPVPYSPPAVPISDDDAYWAAQDLTKEQLAEQLMAAELAGA